MKDEKIYLTKSGYEQFLSELQKLRDSLSNNGKGKSDAYVNAVGDGWHDNFEFEQAKREELRIIADIDYSLRHAECMCAGNYEKETVEMLMGAFVNSTPLPKGLIPITDVMSVFDDFMCGDVDEDGTNTFYEMLKEKVVGADGISD